MNVKNRLGAAGAAFLFLAAVGLPIPSSADSADGAIARLEARADGLEREMTRSGKRGAATLSRMREDIRAIHDEIARLEAGGSVDADRMAALTGRRGDMRGDPAAMARRAEAMREAKQRALAAGPKVGSLLRKANQEDLDRIDDLIAALESGREVDAEALNEYLGVVIADADRDPADRLRESEARMAALKRALASGPKLGSLGRARLQDELDVLSARVERLEREVRR